MNTTSISPEKADELVQRLLCEGPENEYRQLLEFFLDRGYQTQQQYEKLLDFLRPLALAIFDGPEHEVRLAVRKGLAPERETQLLEWVLSQKEIKADMFDIEETVMTDADRYRIDQAAELIQASH